MGGSVAPLRDRVQALLEGRAGVDPWVIAAGMFHACPRELEQHEKTAIERAYTLHIDRATPMEPVNTLSGFALYSRRLRVRVGYFLTEIGADADFEAAGEQSGGSTHESVEDRADADGILIRSVIGSMRNWSGLTGVAIIDVAPEPPEGDCPEIQGDRAVAVHTFTVKSRDALPGTSYGPSL
ncbi:MAG: hypothetical protein IPQ07_38065 [Myxococcales bacterium]|nr:hypothetical protein [Myxococcales bacterium]